MSSFKGLYTFAEVANLYNIDQSTLRHNIGIRFKEDEDVKKMGKTWIIREEALKREFGFVPSCVDNKVYVKRKPGRKSAFDKCKEAYLNGDV